MCWSRRRCQYNILKVVVVKWQNVKNIFEFWWFCKAPCVAPQFQRIRICLQFSEDNNFQLWLNSETWSFLLCSIRPFCNTLPISLHVQNICISQDAFGHFGSDVSPVHIHISAFASSLSNFRQAPFTSVHGFLNDSRIPTFCEHFSDPNPTQTSILQAAASPAATHCCRGFPQRNSSMTQQQYEIWSQSLSPANCGSDPLMHTVQALILITQPTPRLPDSV